MPLGLAVSSALDAVAHGVESYWAKHSNLVSRQLAFGAVSIIMSHIDDLLDGDREAFSYMSQGSMLAGMAFSNTKTTACHSISYPLTMHYQIPHGAAVSMLLAPGMKVNEPEIEKKELLFQALGVGDVRELGERVTDILKKGGFPTALSQWKVKKEDLDHLASLGLTKGRADNNPVYLTPEMIKGILEEIY